MEPMGNVGAAMGGTNQCDDLAAILAQMPVEQLYRLALRARSLTAARPLPSQP